MRMRTALVAVGCLTLVVFASIPGAGQGKGGTNAVSVQVSFRSLSDDAIIGGPVQGTVSSAGSLTASDTTHRIRFFFDRMVDPAPVVNCSAYGGEPFWSMPMPAELETSASLQIYTYWEFLHIDNGDGSCSDSRLRRVVTAFTSSTTATTL